MYKNLIFDISGVLVEWQPREYLMERFLNADTEKRVYDITFGSAEWRLLDAGEITRFEASRRMLENARQAGIAFEVQEVLDDWTNILHTHYRVVELAAQLKANGYKIYYLANSAEDILHKWKHRSFWRLFSGGIASCEVHLLKPQPEIYRLLLDTYHLDPAECVFIDDNPEYVKAAFDLNIASVLMHGSAAALTHSLVKCGVRVRTSPFARLNEPRKKK